MNQVRCCYNVPEAAYAVPLTKSVVLAHSMLFRHFDGVRQSCHQESCRATEQKMQQQHLNDTPLQASRASFSHRLSQTLSQDFRNCLLILYRSFCFLTMSFSSRRRNYLLTPHRRDGLVEWMKKMLMHSFVLDCLETTGGDTFSHFETLIEEHRTLEMEGSSRPSRLKQLVPTVGTFHTRLPLRQAFELYNQKHHLTKRKHIQISFNEVRIFPSKIWPKMP
jgi:IMP-specific 5'-nucleotidase